MNEKNKLDQYYTKKAMAKELFDIAINEIKKYEIDIDKYI